MVAGENPTMFQAMPGDTRVLQAEKVWRSNPHSGPAFVA
jgi:hypothetical protein